MLEPGNNDELPPIPGKRYFTIGEVSDLVCCKAARTALLGTGVSTTKTTVKRRGNRRYYQRQDVMIIRQIRSLLYDAGISPLVVHVSA